MSKGKTKRCPECKAKLIRTPKILWDQSWICTQHVDVDYTWCAKAAKFVCKNWDIKFCSTGRCGRHGEIRVEARKIRKA